MNAPTLVVLVLAVLLLVGMAMSPGGGVARLAG